MAEKGRRADSERENSRRYTGRERRLSGAPSDEVVPVRLMQKLADVVDGVDLRGHDVGDRLPLSRREAELLVAERWAVPTPPEQRRRFSGDVVGDGAARPEQRRRFSGDVVRDTAAECPRPPNRNRDK